MLMVCQWVRKATGLGNEGRGAYSEEIDKEERGTGPSLALLFPWWPCTGHRASLSFGDIIGK